MSQIEGDYPSLPDSAAQRQDEQADIRSRWAELKDWLQAAAIACALVLLVHMYVFHLSTVDGHSMEPTLEDREWLFVNKAVFYLGEPDRGSVVILRDPRPEKEGEFLVKRIVGQPGDTLEAKDGKLIVNGQVVEENYVDTNIEDGNFSPIKLDKGYYFVMGVNRHREASADSRIFGPVTEESITGRVDLILWPPSEFKGL